MATVCQLLSGILISIFNLTNDSRLVFNHRHDTVNRAVWTFANTGTRDADKDINAFTPVRTEKHEHLVIIPKYDAIRPPLEGGTSSKTTSDHFVLCCACYETNSSKNIFSCTFDY